MMNKGMTILHQKLRYRKVIYQVIKPFYTPINPEILDSEIPGLEC